MFTHSSRKFKTSLFKVESDNKSEYFSYLSMKEISGTIRLFSSFYPEKSLMNLYNLLSPYMLHPLYKVLQLVTVLITTILRSVQ